MEAPEAAQAFLQHKKYVPSWEHDMWAYGRLLLELLGRIVDPSQMTLTFTGGSTLEYAANLLSAPPGQTYADKVCVYVCLYVIIIINTHSIS